MGEITAPKTEGRVSIIKRALEIYDTLKPAWVSNVDYIVEMRKIPAMKKAATSNTTGREDNSWYTAVCQIPTYFGIIEVNPADDSQKRLSSIGLAYYNALVSKNKNQQKDIVFSQIENVTFGKNNAGAKRSDSVYELPRIAMKAIYDFEPLKKTDLTKILYFVVQKNLGYDAVKLQMQSEQAGGAKWKFSTLERNENKYLSDPKFIEFLIDNGIICDINKGKHRRPEYIIPADIKKKYRSRIEAFELTNESIITSVQESDEIEFAEEQSFRSAKILSAAELLARETKTPVPCSSGKSKRYKTDPDISKTALDIQKYECQCGGTAHFSFVRRDGITPYVEGHHVIPMKAQKDYPTDSLDIVDNIVGLCPNCHKKVHHGTESDVKSVLSKIYTSARISMLTKFGIADVDSLFDAYYKK